MNLVYFEKGITVLDITIYISTVEVIVSILNTHASVIEISALKFLRVKPLLKFGYSIRVYWIIHCLGWLSYVGIGQVVDDAALLNAFVGKSTLFFQPDDALLIFPWVIVVIHLDFQRLTISKTFWLPSLLLFNNIVFVTQTISGSLIFDTRNIYRSKWLLSLHHWWIKLHHGPILWQFF